MSSKLRACEQIDIKRKFRSKSTDFDKEERGIGAFSLHYGIVTIHK